MKIRRPKNGTTLTHQELLDLLELLEKEEYISVFEIQQRYTEHQLNLFIYIIENAVLRNIVIMKSMFHNVDYIIARDNEFTIVPYINVFNSKN